MSGVNLWAAARRNFLVRRLYEVFFQIKESLAAPISPQNLKDLTGTDEWQGPVQELAWLKGLICSKDDELGQALDSLIKTLRQEALSQEEPAENILTEHFHQVETLLLETACREAGNPLLLRLFLENSRLPVTLWKMETKKLFGKMFPDEPETAYLQAARSYFSSHRLKEALTACEQALAINPGLEEARRRSFIIKGLLRANAFDRQP